MIPTTPAHIPSERDRRDLYRAFAAWTRSASVSEDLVQITLTETWTSKRQPEYAQEWRRWLFGVARNVLLRWRRDTARHAGRTAASPESAAVFEAAAAPDNLEEYLDQHEIIALLDEMLTRLPTDTRDALILKYVESRS